MNRKMNPLLLGTVALLLTLLAAQLKAQDAGNSDVVGEALSPAGKISGNLTSVIASAYQDPTLGILVSTQPNNQNNLSIDIKNLLAKGDTLNLFAWNTWEIIDRECPEFDLGVGYTPHIAHFWKGTLNATGGIQYWAYPSGYSATEAKSDFVTDAGLSWIGHSRLAVAADLKTLITGPTRGKSALLMTVRKDYSIYRKAASSVSLNYGMEYAQGFGFEGYNGPLAIRGDIGLTFAHGGNGITIEYKPQKGLSPRIPSDHFWQVGFLRALPRLIPHWKR